MGKHFYGSHADKQTAKSLANTYASRYKKGLCYNEAVDADCHFDDASKVWTCRATAHHTRGKCQKRQSSNGMVIPVITFSAASPLDGAPGTNVPALDDQSYTDALPGDYAQ